MYHISLWYIYIHVFSTLWTIGWRLQHKETSLDQSICQISGLSGDRTDSDWLIHQAIRIWYDFFSIYYTNLYNIFLKMYGKSGIRHTFGWLISRLLLTFSGPRPQDKTKRKKRKWLSNCFWVKMQSARSPLQERFALSGGCAAIPALPSGMPPVWFGSTVGAQATLLWHNVLKLWRIHWQIMNFQFAAPDSCTCSFSMQQVLQQPLWPLEMACWKPRHVATAIGSLGQPPARAPIVAAASRVWHGGCKPNGFQSNFFQMQKRFCQTKLCMSNNDVWQIRFFFLALLPSIAHLHQLWRGQLTLRTRIFHWAFMTGCDMLENFQKPKTKIQSALWWWIYTFPTTLGNCGAHQSDWVLIVLENEIKSAAAVPEQSESKCANPGRHVSCNKIMLHSIPGAFVLTIWPQDVIVRWHIGTPQPKPMHKSKGKEHTITTTKTLQRTKHHFFDVCYHFVFIKTVVANHATMQKRPSNQKCKSKNWKTTDQRRSETKTASHDAEMENAKRDPAQTNRFNSEPCIISLFEFLSSPIGRASNTCTYLVHGTFYAVVYSATLWNFMLQFNGNFQYYRYYNDLLILSSCHLISTQK